MPFIVIDQIKRGIFGPTFLVYFLSIPFFVLNQILGKQQQYIFFVKRSIANSAGKEDDADDGRRGRPVVHVVHVVHLENLENLLDRGRLTPRL